MDRHALPLEVVTCDYKYDDAVVELDVGGEIFKASPTCIITYPVAHCSVQIGRSRLTQRALVFRDLFGLPRPPSYPPLPPSPDALTKRPAEEVPAPDWDVREAERPFQLGFMPMSIRDPQIEESPEFREQIFIEPASIPLPTSPIAYSRALSTPDCERITLHNTAADFRHFMWAIHAEYVDSPEYPGDVRVDVCQASLTCTSSCSYQRLCQSVVNCLRSPASRTCTSLYAWPIGP